MTIPRIDKQKTLQFAIEGGTRNELCRLPCTISDRLFQYYDAACTGNGSQDVGATMLPIIISKKGYTALARKISTQRC